MTASSPISDLISEIVGNLDLNSPSTQESPIPAAGQPTEPDVFLPLELSSFEDSHLSESAVEALVLKYLLHVGMASGTDIADQLKLPYRLLEGLFRRLKEEQLTVYKGMGSLHDYVHEITDLGCERARRHTKQNTYFGAAPVALSDYVDAVAAQSIANRKPNLEQLKEAYGELVLSNDLFRSIGRAIHSGRGLFLYGKPGNGKTSIAERITRAFGDSIWIPRTIDVWGEIVRLFDPSNHEELPLSAAQSAGVKIDRRWVRIRRPTIIVGGELTMDNLEMTRNHETGINEAPVQLKANCGTLLIDDFGRQRISEAELLNRWILPLEKRYDILSMGSGRKIKVPFDQMIVFSTNLEPRDLVDEAFLRRIPYKIEAKDPTEAEFREIFQGMAASMEISCPDSALDYLLAQYYVSSGRSMRFCHPRDLLQQIHSYCTFEGIPPAATVEAIDAAAENYFGVMYGEVKTDNE